MGELHQPSSIGHTSPGRKGQGAGGCWGRPGGPGDPSDPGGAGDPGDPGGPGDPGEPSGPGDPGDAGGPGNPGEPGGPGGQVTQVAQVTLPLAAGVDEQAQVAR